MPVDVEKEVTTTSTGQTSDQVSQTTTAAQVSTNAEVKNQQATRGNAWIWYIVGIIDVLLLLRLLFHLFGARDTGFTSLLYAISGPLAAPFKGIFAAPTVQGAYFDTAAIAAVIIYILVGWGIAKLIDLAARPSSTNA